MARRGRNLATLAALGALGYALSKRDKGDSEAASEMTRESRRGRTQDEDTVPAAPTTATRAAESDVDAGDFLSRRLKVNPETGEAYSMENLTPMSPATPRAPRAAATAPAASVGVGPGRSAGLGGPTAAELATYARTVPGPGAGRGTGSAGGPSAEELTAYRRQKDLEAMRGRGYGRTYKKGGEIKEPKVKAKGWGKARGARAAKVY